MALVFPAFKKRPGAFPNVLMVLTVSSNEFLSPTSVISVSSTYCEEKEKKSPSPIKINTFYILILSDRNGKYLYT